MSRASRRPATQIVDVEDRMVAVFERIATARDARLPPRA